MSHIPEKQKELEPMRLEFAKKKLEELGYKVLQYKDNQLIFEYKGSRVDFYPYSGWHSGRSITDGRGFQNLLKQLI
jgi:hypothetical protein